MSGSWIGRRLATIAGSAAIVMLAGAVCATAEEAHGIEITGAAIATGTMTPDELSHLPAVEQEVRYRTSKGEEGGRYKGPLLWSVLEARGIADLPGHNAQLKHSFVVEGRDGYRIVFSVGEIDPDFGNAPISWRRSETARPWSREEATGSSYRATSAAHVMSVTW